jgi:hypothetical protein
VLWSGLDSSPVRRIPARIPIFGLRHDAAVQLSTEMECSVFNWRILLGGAASAAILTVGVAAPAFAVPHSTPIPLTGVTQGLNGAGAGGVFCALPNLPVSVGLTAAAGAIGESCSSTQASDPQGSPSQGNQALGNQALGSQSQGDASQTNGPARTTSAASTPSTSGASSAMPGLNSLSGVIPNLGNAASVVPDLGNVTGSLSGSNGSVSGAVGNLVPSGEGSNPVSGVTGALP